MTVVEEIVVKRLGMLDYLPALERMRAYTSARTAETPDELWLLEHPPIYTLGQGARSVPRKRSEIPIVKSDRGGDITYHGPGQVVLYALVDLARRGIKVKQFVWLLEQAVIDLLGRGERKAGAPGVYVNGAKIAALGIRVRQGRAYHGLSLNVDMDLSPFQAIDPCGYPGLAVTRMRDLGFAESVDQAGERLARHLIERIEHA